MTRGRRSKIMDGHRKRSLSPNRGLKYTVQRHTLWGGSGRFKVVGSKSLQDKRSIQMINVKGVVY
jgi:hypothetical protein